MSVSLNIKKSKKQNNQRKACTKRKKSEQRVKVNIRRVGQYCRHLTIVIPITLKIVTIVEISRIENESWWTSKILVFEMLIGRS